MAEDTPEIQKRSYRNPPVVEIAADFQMATGNADEWDWDAASAFLERVVNPGEPIEVLQAVQVRRQPGKSGKSKERELQLSERTLRMRRYSKGKANCLQVAPDRLILNCVKTSEQIPKFTTLEPLVVQYLSDYTEAFRPREVESISLNYIDDVKITHEGPLDLAEYFNINATFPEAFGGVAGFSVGGKWVDGDVTILLEFTDIEPYTFRLDWTAMMVMAKDSGQQAATAGLQKCRRMLWDRFSACFTEKGHGLFNPT